MGDDERRPQAKAEEEREPLEQPRSAPRVADKVLVLIARSRECVLALARLVGTKVSRSPTHERAQVHTALHAEATLQRRRELRLRGRAAPLQSE